MLLTISTLTRRRNRLGNSIGTAHLTSMTTPILNGFRRQYTLRDPYFDPDVPRIPSQCWPICGLSRLTAPPALDVSYGIPPGVQRERSPNTYIWVIDANWVPYIIESTILRLHGPPKHTNLTGGGQAYVGGELWFRTDTSLYVSGGSGRYFPCHEQQLEDAVEVFRSFGYGVISLGWDPNSGARRFLEVQ